MMAMHTGGGFYCRPLADATKETPKKWEGMWGKGPGILENNISFNPLTW